MPLNPNAARDVVNSYTTKTKEEKNRLYPLFFESIHLDVFRHIRDLKMDFVHPITVISGSNRVGKTSVLMAIACSHYNFERQDVANGDWKRATWSHLVRFTNYDKQPIDWKYSIKYREGDSIKITRGYRRAQTKKWGGAGKKEGQIGRPTGASPSGGRHVCLIDLNRINPGRHLTYSTFNKARNASSADIDNGDKICAYLSYILETDYEIKKLIDSADNTVCRFSQDSGEYSSFNTASGEDVLLNLLMQILYLPKYSLILIDELEIGLHPKIQRRMMDVLYMISEEQQKQFIVTSHSYAIIDSVPRDSHIFVEPKGDGTMEGKPQLSTYESLTRMDSYSFPVADVYVEDAESESIVMKAISELNTDILGFARLVKVIVVGNATKTYNYFSLRQELHHKEYLSAKPACILDGDMQNKKNTSGGYLYPKQDNLFFHYSNEAPEKMLVQLYLKNHSCAALTYHVEHSNPHCLFDKMVELNLASNKEDAFEQCFNSYKQDINGQVHFNELKEFLKKLIA